MLRKNYDSGRIFFLLVVLFCSCGRVNAQNVPDQYKRYFVKFTDNRSIIEKVLNAAGLSNEDMGRSFALICGISNYPKMGVLERKLAPAAEDVRKMKNYLLQKDFFDEIVVLENSDVTLENIQYFLQSYFPARLKKFPNSRFLFAYSGHGMTENNKGYLIESTASSLSDKTHAINLDVLHVYLNEVISVGHHVLVLLNSCYGGSFLKRRYGGEELIPKYPGAHAITAGGSSEETWHDSALGNGSVFFEKIIAGLGGIADTHADGIVTAHELASYLIDEIRTFSDQEQNPQWGDISLHGSQGEFFFLNKKRPITLEYKKKFNPSQSMGGRIRSDSALDKEIKLNLNPVKTTNENQQSLENILYLLDDGEKIPFVNLQFLSSNSPDSLKTYIQTDSGQKRKYINIEKISSIIFHDGEHITETGFYIKIDITYKNGKIGSTLVGLDGALKITTLDGEQNIAFYKIEKITFK